MDPNDGVDSPELHDLIQRAIVVFNSRKKIISKKSHTAKRPERLKRKRTCNENVLLERAADFSSDDVCGDEDTGIDDSVKAGLDGVVTCDCGAMHNVIDFDLIFSKMYTFVDRNILVSPDWWAPILYTSKLTSIDEIMKVNQQSATDMRIAVQYESGWNFSGWVVGVENGNCDHYKVCARTFVHVYVVSMKWCYLKYSITIFEDCISYVHLTHSISMMVLMRRHIKDGYSSAFSLRTRQIDLTNYVCWIPQSMASINHAHGA